MIDIRQLVPDSLSHFRGAIGEAFEYFLQRTSSTGLLRGREAEHSKSLDSWVRLALERPTLHKLAQILSRHRGLPPDLRAGLQTLESFAPHTPLDEVINIARTELGDDLAQLELGDAALAEASVAVVVPFVWRTPRSGRPARGVLKVLKPHIGDRLEHELAAWAEVTDFFEAGRQKHGLPDVDYRESFDTVATLLRREIDFAAEQRHLAAAAEALCGVPGVRIPRLLPFCTSKVTAMERIDGAKVTNVDPLAPEARRRLAERIVEALIAQPMWSATDAAMFHADPHAGNLMATDEGDLAILDWAMVGTLGEDDRVQLSQLILSAYLRDSCGVCNAVERLCRRPLSNTAAVRRVVDRQLGRMPQPFGPIFSWVAALLDAAVVECGARFGEDLLLFRKSLLVLEGVVADIVGEGGLDRLLLSSAFRQLVREWPARVFLPPVSRRLGSRLSSFDLARAGSLWPWVVASPWVNARGP